MSGVERVLRGVAPELETEVQRRLSGFFGGFLRLYLPQTWVFRTEQGAATLCVDERGAVTVAPGELPSADVTVEMAYDRLRRLLTNRAREPPGTEPPRVTTHTAKGRVAFGYLRDRLGLGAS